MPVLKPCFKIVLASPSDVPKEREIVAKIVEEIQNLKKAELSIDLYRWETDTHPAFHPLGPQGVIDEALGIEDADIFIGIFYLRFGTPVYDAGSGTEHEIKKAIKSWEEKRAPDIKLYFKNAAHDPFKVDFDQFKRVKDFRDSILAKGIIKDFNSEEEFEKAIRAALLSYIDKKLKSPTPALPQPTISTQTQHRTYPKPSKIFTGRKAELTEFKSEYENSNILAIEGLGGTGKTEFAAKCIEDFIDNTSRLVWFVCQTGSKIDTLIEEAGFPDVLKGENKTELAKYSGFRDLIEKHEKIIFIDNFQDADASFTAFLRFAEKYLKKSKLILLSREHPSTLKIKVIKLEGLKTDSLEFAKKTIAEFFPNIKTDDKKLRIICEKVGGHPFAIELALKLLNYGDSPEEIITRLNTVDFEALSRRLLEVFLDHPNTTNEEKKFLFDFSILRGSITRECINEVIGSDALTLRKLIDKLILTHSDGLYETHPLIKEFCYSKNENRKTTHLKAAEYYKKTKTLKFDPVLNDEVLYHLMMAEAFELAANFVCETGEDFIRMGYTNSILEVIENLQNGFDRPMFYIFLGDIFTIRGVYEKALSLYEKAFSTDDEKVCAEAYLKYGETLYRKGLVKESLRFFEDAYGICNRLNFLKCAARSLNDIGLVLKLNGDPQGALEKFQESLKTAQEIGDKSGIAVSLNNIGGVLVEDKGDAKGALEKYQESLNIRLGIGDKSGIANSLNNIGYYLFTKNDPEGALEKYQESLNIWLEIGDKIGSAATLNNIGTALYEKGDAKGALEKHQESLMISQEIGDKSGIATSLHNIGAFYCEKGEKIKGLGFLLKSLALTNQMGIKQDHTLQRIFILKREGLRNFRKIAETALNSLENELKPYIDIENLTYEDTIRNQNKTGRNELCPCGSGKKFKRCCDK